MIEEGLDWSDIQHIRDEQVHESSLLTSGGENSHRGRGNKPKKKYIPSMHNFVSATMMAATCFSYVK